MTPPGEFPTPKSPATIVPPIFEPSNWSEPLSWLQVPSSEVKPEFGSPAVSLSPL